MKAENHIVNGLWIGSILSKLELLTIHSFLANGHSFRLWTYDKIETPLPPGVEVCDASDIIPAAHVFSYKYANKYGHGKGSYAGFSDIFRYRLLYEYGGWWVDMDVTCLQPLDFDAPYFFRDHHELMVVGNVMKCPKNSDLMKQCYDEAFAEVTESNTDWHKPIDILNRNILNGHLEKYIEKGVSNPDKWEVTSRFIWERDIPPSHWYFIHWQNEEWRYKQVSKEDFYYRSEAGRQMQRYGLMDRPVSLFRKMANILRYSGSFRNFRQIFRIK